MFVTHPAIGFHEGLSVGTQAIQRHAGSEPASARMVPITSSHAHLSSEVNIHAEVGVVEPPNGLAELLGLFVHGRVPGVVTRDGIHLSRKQAGLLG
jgi:hypothetical protein